MLKDIPFHDMNKTVNSKSKQPDHFAKYQPIFQNPSTHLFICVSETKYTHAVLTAMETWVSRLLP